MWNMLSVIKYGKWLDLNELGWLRQTQGSNE